jgi:trimeric autotransporter adhesin
VKTIFVHVLLLAACLPSLAAKNALETAISGPNQLAIDANGNLYVSEEYGKRILRIDLSKNAVRVVAGNGRECCQKENVLARESSVYHVYSLALDSSNNLYIGGTNARDDAFVRIVHSATGRIATLARGGFPHPAIGINTLQANLSDPQGIVVLPDTTVLVSASEFNVIVELGGTTKAFAGDSTRKTFSGDGGLSSEAGFDLPGALAVDDKGNVFLADYYNHRIRRIDARTHVVDTVAGNGSNTSSGNGGRAIAAGVPYPGAIAVDAAGDVFVIENGQFMVRRIDAVTGVITTVAGTGHDGFSGDGGTATNADINPAGVAVHGGNLYISDIEHNRIRRVDAAGIISTIAGNGLPHRKASIE